MFLSLIHYAFLHRLPLFEFHHQEVMPFGLCNAPATFQHLMESVLNGLTRDICVVYLDDILVVGKTFKEHLANLTKVFRRIREARLKLKPAKCHVVRKEVKYLGCLISPSGTAAGPKKIDAVKNYPTPTDLKTSGKIIPRTCIVQMVHSKFFKCSAQPYLKRCAF